MIKKTLIGALLLTGFVFLSGSIAFAAEEVKPWESMTRFRAEERLTAQDMEMPKGDFHVYREKMKAEHKEERMLQRQERLQDAIERGCITEEEMESKMQTRRGRFSK